ncbi:hypothetical protein GCM10025857_37090 [Alicyclobacillus contaminans]|nr:hypothetical protein GCM10025857_37090 [Alicyclobacillus contaminans]
MRIPDVLTLPGAVLMLIASGALRIQGWWWAFVGALVCGGGMFLIHLFARGQMGLGDVKLFLSIGAMLGAVGGLESLVLAALYGTCIGVFLRVLRRVSKREPIPFGPFIAMGAITVAVYGSEITRWYVGLVTPFG